MTSQFCERSMSTLKMNNKFIDKVLYTGQVPQPLYYEIPREELVLKLAQQIKQASHAESGRLVIHGPPGSGKSRLLASALRSQVEIVGDYFDKVYWIVDNTNPDQLKTLLTDLLCRLNCELLTKFSANQDPGNNVPDLIKEELRKCPKTLLIIDGVQNEQCVETFSAFPCTIIFTTCLLDIFESIRYSIDFFKIGKRQEFTLVQVKELAQHFEFILEPEQARIFKMNSGNNPALMVKLLNSAKANPGLMDLYMGNVASQPFENFRYKSSYCYYSLSERIHALTRFLTGPTKDSFEACSALPPDEWLDNQIFQLVWPVDSCGMESLQELIMQVLADIDELVNTSFMEKNDEMNTPFQTHLIYPIIHSHLLRNLLKHKPRQVKTIAELLLSRLENEVNALGMDNNGVVSEFYDAHAEKLKELILKSNKEVRNQKTIDIEPASPAPFLTWIASQFKYVLGY